ncbi:MAG: hypothetical protein H6832_11630 [Planctomycetes bacterium]|nr:hypothetical protein [Planctomycetota bacterium]MCB9919042.1 hypothetical protein [Planctomycetota bacterium]
MSEAVEREGAARETHGEWHIAQTAKHCHACHAPFLPGHEYWSTLHVSVEGDDASPVLMRRDSCDACWKGSTEAIYWRTRRSENKADQNVVDIAAMHQLFLGLLDDDREEVEALRYVIALMLTRKKILKPVRQVGGARGDLVFKHPRDENERLRLGAPELSEESLERLKAQLGDILD